MNQPRIDETKLFDSSPSSNRELANSGHLSSSARLIAGGIVLLGAILFSTKAIMVKLAMQYGVDALPFLLLRMMFSLPFYLLILFWIRRSSASHPPVGQYLVRLIMLGVIGFYLAAYFDFVGLAYITASLERVILYLYPTIVLLISFTYLKKTITAHQWIAIVLCYVGVFVAVRYGHVDDGSGQQWIGVVLVFLSAVTYAIYLVGSGELIPKIGVWSFTCYAMIVSSICVLAHSLISIDVREVLTYPWQVYAYGLAMAVFATVIPSFLISEGIKRIGASNAAIIGGVGPISTIVLATVFLGESLTYPQMIGTALVVSGVCYISFKMKQPLVETKTV